MGVYASYISKDQSASNVSNEVTIGIEKKPIPSGPTVINGVKKTWTGPTVTHESNDITAGGWTEWTKIDTDLQ